MGMTIDDCIDWLCRLRSNVLIFMPYVWHKKMTDALTMAIDTMRKYQKIRLIINKWNAGIYDDEGLCDIEVLEKIDAIIDEVIEDGNET